LADGIRAGVYPNGQLGAEGGFRLSWAAGVSQEPRNN